MKAQITLTPSESKRLIAKAILKHERIKKALTSGTVVINLGSTNAYIAEEILKKKFPIEQFVAGLVDGTGTCVVPKKERLQSVVIKKGRIVDENAEKITRTMGPGDVFIKGANAVDSNGTAWVMLASETGGTMGHVLGTLMARGVPILIPVGLEKFVPENLDKVSSKAGIFSIQLSTGVPVGILPVPGEVFTEREAFQLLGDVEVYLVGAGGIGGGEGSITFLIEGDEKEVKDIFDGVKKIKGEVNVVSLRGSCGDCVYSCPDNKSL